MQDTKGDRVDDLEKKKLPWFRFHAADWLTSPAVQLMSRVQQSIFIDLLCYIHLSGNCRLSASRDEAKRLLKLFESESGELDQVWSELMVCPEDPNAVTHKKMWAWYTSDRECSERKRKAGKASAAKRRSNADLTGTQQDCSSEATDAQQGVYESNSMSPSVSNKVRFERPTLEMAKEYFKKKGGTEDQAHDFFLFYESKGWKVGKNPMQRWKACASLWIRREEKRASGGYQVNRDNKTEEILKNAFQ